ncbi:CinA family protein [Vallicoccus soli]|uniref:CinA family protein n=1 Tax=Vallicoccus soli TaxID=2339232 RepID=A0A3A3ZKT7_9ACTN|nr:CinA family protein [Vallicoccus soli]
MLAPRLVERLAARGATLAVAESLTGGLLTAAVVAVPGASAVLRGGVTAYATDLKATLLGVDRQRLAATGPVDGEVVRQMARGAAARLDAGHGVATTGVAGPEPQGGRPVGEVWVAATGPQGELVRRLHLPGDRSAVREGAVAAALALLLELLDAPPAGGAEQAG